MPGYAYARTGRIDDALPLLEQAAVEEDFSVALVFAQSQWWTYLSEAFLFVNRIEDAYRHAKRALALSIEYEEGDARAHTLHLLGDIAMQLHPPETDRAETHYQEALTLAEELQMRPLQAHCHRGLGTLYSQTGQSELARAELSTAIQMYCDMEMTFWLPETEPALAEVEAKA